MPTQSEITGFFKELQSEICSELEKIDGKEGFRKDPWERTGGGGGLTRVMNSGKVFERGGVNFSEVFGKAPEFLSKESGNADEANTFFASGVSLVIHPFNPHVPIIHMNVRFLRVGDKSWFGGGIDLTPHYVVKEDAVFFHHCLKSTCDKFDPSYYPDFKKNADDYFFLKHRKETRGVGGIFFDHLGVEKDISLDNLFAFVKATGETFIPAYSEIVRRNREKSFTEEEKMWQRLRRGRYVEFNLIYDRGTKFGLETDGRTESILMSLPPLAQWEYDYKPAKGSKEEQTLSFLKKGIDWLS